MDSITTVRPPTPASPAAGFESRAPVFDTAQQRSETKTLDPAVSVELSSHASEEAQTTAERRRYEVDSATQALVFRVTNVANGDVIVQIPDEVVLKARAYAQQTAAAAGERIERRA